MTNHQLDQLTINTIRTLSMDAVQQANSGHPGAPLALAPVASTVWQHFLRFDPEDPAQSRVRGMSPGDYNGVWRKSAAFSGSSSVCLLSRARLITCPIFTPTIRGTWRSSASIRSN